MAASNVGRPLGNAVAAAFDELGSPQLMYFILAAVFAVLSLILWLVRFPTSAPTVDEIVDSFHPIAAGQPVPKID
jgi:hypothetical protein